MANMRSGKLLFGRYTREECGLPPEAGRPSRKRLLVRFFALLVVLFAVGWAAGVLTARWRESWMTGLPAMVLMADSAEIPGLLAKGRLYAAALPERPVMARDLAIAAMLAAERSPRRMGYYGNLAKLVDGLPEGLSATPAGDFMTELFFAGIHHEVGDFQKAFAALGRAEAALQKIEDEVERRSRQLLLANSQAYFLATAPKQAGRNPERALHLAQPMIAARDQLPGGGYASDSAALLDTLATAWYAAGQPERAAKIQSLALGLADGESLDTYLRHYDEFIGEQ